MKKVAPESTLPIFTSPQGSDLYYEIEGQGPPLLMIHGFLGTGRSEFPALRAWLARRYQVICPDLRGYGQSGPKPRRFGADFYWQDAADMAALVAHLKLSDLRVLGYSDGGEVALCLPLLAPERVRAVLTWGATGHFSPAIKPAILAMLNIPWEKTPVAQLHGQEHMRVMVETWVQAMLQIVDRGGDISYSRVAEITCPVCLILGDRDSLNPMELGAAMAAALPQGRLISFRQTGHAVHQERAWWFRWHVGRFLAKG